MAAANLSKGNRMSITNRVNVAGLHSPEEDSPSSGAVYIILLFIGGGGQFSTHEVLTLETDDVPVKLDLFPKYILEGRRQIRLV